MHNFYSRDRYKDILTATEAIKSIESISESIVQEIQDVLEKCNGLVSKTNTIIPIKQHTEHK